MWYEKPEVRTVISAANTSQNIQMVWVSLDALGNMEKSFSIVINGLHTGLVLPSRPFKFYSPRLLMLVWC